jgi:hypothetical protein
MRTYKTTTYAALIKDTTPAKFIRKADKKHLEKLSENQYFAVMVTDSVSSDSPHIRGVEAFDHCGLVGIEKTSGETGWYISKNYAKRDGKGRGTSLIIEVKPADISKFCLLDR